MDDDSRRRVILTSMRRRYVENRLSLFGSLLLGFLGGSAVYRLHIGLLLLPVVAIVLVFVFGIIQSRAMLSLAAQGLTSRELALPPSGRGKTLIVINIVMGLVGGFLCAYMTSRMIR